MMLSRRGAVEIIRVGAILIGSHGFGFFDFNYISSLVYCGGFLVLCETLVDFGSLQTGSVWD